MCVCTRPEMKSGNHEHPAAHGLGTKRARIRIPTPAHVQTAAPERHTARTLRMETLVNLCRKTTVESHARRPGLLGSDAAVRSTRPGKVRRTPVRQTPKIITDKGHPARMLAWCWSADAGRGFLPDRPSLRCASYATGRLPTQRCTASHTGTGRAWRVRTFAPAIGAGPRSRERKASTRTRTSNTHTAHRRPT